MWEAFKSVAFVLFSVMVALILQAHADVEDRGDDRTDDVIQETLVQHVQSQLPNN